ncbi:MAG: helix-turn-helix domain-containing protein [Chryseobacterium sp.]|jgi:addiction module HigA family antidote|uniref:helix-turn-helix transcriptional regulator n=1 Tax=Chryseobacterium sp. TaxID=1871047 RepID=UPI00281D05AD|nr:helix-turn-helix domain-containing protein [Chryseobacterium sp.]MDR2236085.1 helix-turn-helix domain-containing protein [Chryseobacterium sp.]
MKTKQSNFDIQKNGIKDFIKAESLKQDKERILRNKLLSIQYQIEDYIESDTFELEKSLKALDFIKMYLKVLKITKKDLARYLDMQDSNLHKYLSGERKLNAQVVLKLSNFTHTEPELWFRIQIKNELLELKKESEKVADYSKYDYRHLVENE